MDDAFSFTSVAAVRQVVSQTPVPIFLFGMDGRLIFGNSEAGDVAGVALEALVGRAFDDLFPAPSSLVETFPFSRLLIDPRCEVERRFQHHDGGRSAVLVKCSRLTTVDDEQYLLAVPQFGTPTAYTEAYSAFSLQNVADKVLRMVVDTVDCTRASVQLVVNNRRILLSAYGFDKRKVSPRLLGRLENDLIVKQIMESHRIRVIPDTRAVGSLFAQLPETADVNSWIGIPIVHGVRPLAFITVDHDRRGFYGNLAPETLAALEHLANEAASEINEAYLFDAAAHQLQAFDLVNRIAEIVETTWDEGNLLRDVAETIGPGIGCDHCQILLAELDAGQQVLVTRGRWPTDRQPMRAVVTSGALPQSVVEAFSTGKVVTANRVFDAPHADDPHAAGAPPPQSIIVVPIKGVRETLGVLVAVHSRSNWFGDGTALLLETLMRHTALALERNAGLERVKRGGRTILGTTDIRTIVTEMVSASIELTHSDSGVIYLLNEDGTKIVNSFCPAGFSHPAPRLDKEDGITRQVFRSGAIHEFEDIAQHHEIVNPALIDTFASMVAVPLLVEESRPTDIGYVSSARVIGVLYLNGKKRRRLTGQERAFLMTLADQAAIAIQIRNSDALYHSLIDHIPQFVFRKDRESRFTWANKAFCDLLKLPLESVKGKTDYDFYPKEIAARYVADDLRVMETGRLLWRTAEPNQTSEGLRWMRVVKTPVLDAENRVTGVQAIFSDVTVEEQLQERYRSLVDQSPDSIVVHNAGLLTMANPAAVRLFGVGSEKELLDRPILDFVYRDDRWLAADRLRQLNSNEDVAPVEMRMCPVGEDKPVEVEVHARPLESAQEAGSEVQVVFHDLTQVNRTLMEMHHRLSHVLSNVRGFLAWEMKTHPELSDVALALSNRIKAMSVVQEILRSDKHNQRIPMKMYLDRLNRYLGASHGAADPVSLFVQPRELTLTGRMAEYCGLIVTELVSNAFRHAFTDHRKGSIRVRLITDPDGQSELEVTDDGKGLSASDLHASTGLSLVESFARRDLRGTFTLDERPGGGVRGRVSFNAGPL